MVQEVSPSSWVLAPHFCVVYLFLKGSLMELPPLSYSLRFRGVQMGFALPRLKVWIESSFLGRAHLGLYFSGLLSRRCGWSICLAF